MAKQVTVNKDRRLYVIPSGTGYSCLGFDNAERQRVAVLKWAGASIEPVKIGTLDAYNAYHDAMMTGFAHHDATKKRCDIELTPQLVGLEGKRVEVVDCDGEKRRFYVGRSTGWMPRHLEIAQRNSSGGCGVYGAPFKSVRVVY